jgi:hypothetical protein
MKIGKVKEEAMDLHTSVTNDCLGRPRWKDAHLFVSACSPGVEWLLSVSPDKKEMKLSGNDLDWTVFTARDKSGLRLGPVLFRLFHTWNFNEEELAWIGEKLVALGLN